MHEGEESFGVFKLDHYLLVVSSLGRLGWFVYLRYIFDFQLHDFFILERFMSLWAT